MLKLDLLKLKQNEDEFALPCSAEGGIGTFLMLLLLKRVCEHNYIYSTKKVNVILLIDFEYHEGSMTLNKSIKEQPYLDMIKKSQQFISVDGMVPTLDWFYFINSFKGKLDIKIRASLLKQDIHSGEFGGLVADSTQVVFSIFDRIFLKGKCAIPIQG